MGRIGASGSTLVTSTSAASMFGDDGLDVRGINYLMVKMTPGLEDLTVCDVKVKVHPDDSEWVIIATDPADYTSPEGPIVGASASLVTLAADATGWIIIKVMGFSRLNIDVTAAGDGRLVHSHYGHDNR